MPSQTDHLRPPVPHPGISLTAAIAARSALRPDAAALVGPSGTVTYADLETRANRLAHYLKVLGAGSDAPVGLCLERSPEFVIAALAILKCGAAYLPMDPAHPAERLQLMVKDSAIPILVTTKCLAGQFAELDLKVVDIACAQEAIAAQPDTPPEVDGAEDDLAYIIYTSGSTGAPKGVEIARRNLANLISWHIDTFKLQAADRMSFLAGVGFDAAVWEIWPPLTVGASLHLPDDSVRFSAEALQDWLVQHQITVSFTPTAIAEELISRAWPAGSALRFLLTGADTLHRHPSPGLPFTLVNNYGPTECTVVATSGIIAAIENPAGLPSIGHPIDNVEIHIVDETLREVVPGSSGEIYIGGAGVARGYRNRPNLTAERFIADPRSRNGNRWYRTGDFGRHLPSGEIEFLGRVDDQVKIRGYRIELNEINAVLNTHPSVKASFVMAREDRSGDKRLVAYLVRAADSPQDDQQIRDLVRRRLPDYMEPAALVWIDSLPFTSNGKVDRAALPAPVASPGTSPHEHLAAQTPLENSVAGIIADVLGIPRVSSDADFFALGGHSLLGAQIVARIRSAFGVELKLLDVFEAPTAAELACRIEEALTGQLNSMTEGEVEAALAALNSVGASETQGG